MKDKTFVCVFLIFALLQVAVTVKLSVYYETLCPDSMNFIKYQLYPTWLLLNNTNLQVDFVPYGKATQEKSSNGTWTFDCQHGSRECQGNRIHACALSVLENNITAQVNFISCTMSTRNPPRASSQCASALGIDYTPIESCAGGMQGDELLAEMGNRTLNFQPTITFIPTVAFNDVYNQTDQDEAMDQLTTVVCRYMSDPKPAACN